MEQWKKSWQIYDKIQQEWQHVPLTTAEKALLDNLTPKDWKKLDSARDPESKLRLTESRMTVELVKFF